MGMKMQLPASIINALQERPPEAIIDKVSCLTCFLFYEINGIGIVAFCSIYNFIKCD